MVKAKVSCEAFLLHYLTWTSLVLGVCLRQASRGEQFRWALSVAVLGYGVSIRVLMLHALLVQGDRRMLERVRCRDSHTLPTHSSTSTVPRDLEELS